MGLLLLQGEACLSRSHQRAKQRERRREAVGTKESKETEAHRLAGAGRPLNKSFYTLVSIAIATVCIGTWPDILLNVSHFDFGYSQPQSDQTETRQMNTKHYPF